MAAFSIAGNTLPISSFEELEPRRRGEITVAFANTLRSSVSSEKRQFRVVSTPVNNTLATTIRTALANAATVVVTGDVLLGVSLNCKGTVTYALVGIGSLDAGYNFVYVLTLMLMEA